MRVRGWLSNRADRRRWRRSCGPRRTSSRPVYGDHDTPKINSRNTYRVLADSRWSRCRRRRRWSVGKFLSMLEIKTKASRRGDPVSATSPRRDRQARDGPRSVEVIIASSLSRTVRVLGDEHPTGTSGPVGAGRYVVVRRRARCTRRARTVDRVGRRCSAQPLPWEGRSVDVRIANLRPGRRDAVSL